jgi:hypothetical protein
VEPNSGSRKEKTMKPLVLSKPTIAILRNFSKISDHLMFQAGSIQKIRNGGMYAEAKVAEEFPCEFPVELRVFVGLAAIFKQPHLDFVHGSHIRMTEGGRSSEEAIYAFDPTVEEKAQAFSTNKRSLLAPKHRIDFLITAAQHATMQLDAKRKTGTTNFNMGFVSDGRRIAADYFVTSEDKSTIPIDRCGWLLKGDPHGISCGVTLAKHVKWPLLKGGYRGIVSERHTMLTGLDVTYLIAHEPALSWFESAEAQ